LGNLTYGYDLAGRRMSVGGSYARTGLPSAVSTTVYNANNQLTTWGAAHPAYDLNGNMTSDGAHSYTWDARNHLKQIDAGMTASFVYDPFGRRSSKTISGTATSFLYDSANAVQEIIGANTANSLMGGVDEVFQRTDSSGARSFLTDALGSTIALTDSTATVQTSYTVDPFGNTTSTGVANSNTFEFTGRELDAANLNLYFYRARYFNPQLQRFISEDPIGLLGGSTNPYPYTFNNPISFTDPSGRCPMCVIAIAGGAIGGAVAGYQAYESGARGWDLAAAAAGGAGTGILAGLTGGLVGGIAIEAGASAVAAGAWGGAAAVAVTGFGNGEIGAATGGTLVGTCGTKV
jgi:RHS repeat-associated protein